MKKKEKGVLRSKEIDDLKKALDKARVELKKTQAEIYGGKEKNLKKGKNLRRDIAQILTIIKEKELLAQGQTEKEEK